MGLNERLVAIGVLVTLALLAGYNYQAGRSNPIDAVAQAQIQASR